MFLEINGISATATPNDDVYGFVVDVGTSREVSQLAADVERPTRR